VKVLDAVIGRDIWQHFSYGPFNIFEEREHTAAKMTLEWNYGDVKILCSVIIASYGGELLGFDDYGYAHFKPTYRYHYINSINYIHWPTVEKLYDLYVKLSDASEKAEAKMREKGKKGF